MSSRRDDYFSSSRRSALFASHENGHRDAWYQDGYRRQRSRSPLRYDGVQPHEGMHREPRYPRSGEYASRRSMPEMSGWPRWEEQPHYLPHDYRPSYDRLPMYEDYRRMSPPPRYSYLRSPSPDYSYRDDRGRDYFFAPSEYGWRDQHREPTPPQLRAPPPTSRDNRRICDTRSRSPPPYHTRDTEVRPHRLAKNPSKVGRPSKQRREALAIGAAPRTQQECIWQANHTDRPIPKPVSSSRLPTLVAENQTTRVNKHDQSANEPSNEPSAEPPNEPSNEPSTEATSKASGELFDEKTLVNGAEASAADCENDEFMMSNDYEIDVVASASLGEGNAQDLNDDGPSERLKLAATDQEELRLLNEQYYNDVRASDQQANERGYQMADKEGWMDTPKPTPLVRQGLSHNLRFGQQMQNLIDEALDAAKHSSRDNEEDSEIVMPKFGDNVSYRSAAVAIVRNADGPITHDELLHKFEVFSNKMGHTLSKTWKKGFRQRIFSRGTVLSIDDHTKLVSLGPSAKLDSYAAQAFYGSGMSDALERTAGLQDDIKTRPQLLVVTVRRSSTGRQINIGKSEMGLSDFMEESARCHLDYYLKVHGGRREGPKRIESAASIREGEDRDNLVWFYKMVRGSTAPAMQQDNLKPAACDHEFAEILDRLGDSVGPDDKARVTIVVAGVDGWTTDIRSLCKLVADYPRIDFRVTMVLPARLTVNIEHVFASRGEFSWAHFDLSLVAMIATELEKNPSSLLQWQFADQYGLIFILDHAQHAKVLQQGGSGGSSDESRNWRDAEPIAAKLLGKLQRNHLEFPAEEKACCLCGSHETSQDWSRGPDGEDNVCCTDCCEAPESDTRGKKAKQKALSTTTGTNTKKTSLTTTTGAKTRK